MSRGTRGISKIELLVVLAILGGLAGVTLPRMQRAEEGQQIRELEARLETVRAAVEAYRRDHEGAWPGLRDGLPDDEVFAAQLCETTNLSGVVDPDADLGPYLETVLPANPLNGLSTVDVVGGEQEMQPDGTTGWRFDLETGRFAANTTGQDRDGAAYADY